MIRILALLLLASLPLCGQMTLQVRQPNGAGHLRLDVARASAHAELFVLISNAPATPTGSGPLLGLSLTNADLVLQQLQMPMGSDPHHVRANGQGEYRWEIFWNPVMATANFDVLAFHWTPMLGIQARTPVQFVSVQL